MLLCKLQSVSSSPGNAEAQKDNILNVKMVELLCMHKCVILFNFPCSLNCFVYSFISLISSTVFSRYTGRSSKLLKWILTYELRNEKERERNTRAMENLIKITICWHNLIPPLWVSAYITFCIACFFFFIR